ncbi:MAG: transcription antitermination factor NusB [Treponema sp.]|jgi:N utilization substance protein B|nr:transcription antitermination factor NusB [Treponema sp.]
MASRRKGRILAFQALYFWEAGRDTGADAFSGEISNKQSVVSAGELIKFAWVDEEKLKKYDESIITFSRVLITGALENISEIDNMIKRHLENWDISRLNRVDLAILRMSAYTLMFQKEIPPTIVIDEAIGICREFGADDSFRFVNGVLDSIRKTCVK